MESKEAKFQYLLHLGDNALVLGHRLSEWCAKAPILEEDLAISNMALDNIGRAQALLKYAGEVEGKGRSEDDLAYKRAERKFLNNLISELANGDFAFTIARQLVNASFGLLYFQALTNSNDETIAGISAKTVKELKYHVRHAKEWTLRLGDGTQESHEKMQQALNDVWMYTGELFEVTEWERVGIKDGWAVDASSFKDQWKSSLKEIVEEASLTLPEDAYMQTGGRSGKHTENLGFILAEMQYLQRAYPDANW